MLSFYLPHETSTAARENTQNRDLLAPRWWANCGPDVAPDPEHRHSAGPHIC